MACPPTAPGTAPELGASSAALEAFRDRALALTCIAGIGGLPQLTLPIGTVAGCRVAAWFIGWVDGDEARLKLASAIASRCVP